MLSIILKAEYKLEETAAEKAFIVPAVKPDILAPPLALIFPEKVTLPVETFKPIPVIEPELHVPKNALPSAITPCRYSIAVPDV